MTEDQGTVPEPFVEPVGEPIMGTVAETPAVTPTTDPVAEPVPAAVPATTASAGRPTDVVIVTVLALLAALGDVIAGTAWLIEKDSISAPAAWAAWATLLIGLATAAVAALFFQGSAVARWLIAIVMCAHIAVHIAVWVAVGSDAAVAAMIQLLISGTVLLLLFSEGTTAYLKGAKR